MKTKYKSIFLSDIHLGTSACKAHLLNSFLKKNTAERFFLVGDIIDGWQMSKRIYFNKDQVEFIKKILKLSKDNVVIYVAGNHDEFLRKYLNEIPIIHNIVVVDQFDYYSVNNNRYLVIHGDQFDFLMHNSKWVMHVGDFLYTLLIQLNSIYNRCRKIFGYDYWSLSAFIKSKTKSALDFIFSFKKNLTDWSKSHGYKGVICGHIHTAEISQILDVEYMNCGDWVESCTALVETLEGEWKIIKWTGE